MNSFALYTVGFARAAPRGRGTCGHVFRSRVGGEGKNPMREHLLTRRGNVLLSQITMLHSRFAWWSISLYQSNSMTMKDSR
ncbi:hypothetical protein ASPACDRAFT_116563 [Aspergillus aculeatus ATCC 16872]|uniref:Uncharacterized protein n=1 Tax=Aspergillus aculeatus (strain ATCC 16872 / CBS 172.66 / WB 5094) TaxID=690307 RepID=A0A1L9WZF3_ASPA1|nr:uncharacterized protein ASPACDRAFT_116563 [Aspergillus aculeatus ATCC 16872]OJK01652.1 hypothetical protein ASPACDRAFT_116563 [Aspergillus aculeatus ATCC 16872]